MSKVYDDLLDQNGLPVIGEREEWRPYGSEPVPLREKSLPGNGTVGAPSGNSANETFTGNNTTGVTPNPYVNIRRSVEAGTPFYDAFVSQFGNSRRSVDEKRAKRNKMWAGIADMATLIGDMVGGYSEGNVVRRNGSIAAGYEDKLQKYRDYYDSINRDVDVMAYNARIADINNRLHRGERLEDMVMKTAFFNEENDRKTKEAEYKAERDKKNDEFKERQLVLEENKLKEMEKNNRDKASIERQKLVVSKAKAEVDKANKTYTLVGQGGRRYVIPKNDEGIIGYLFSIMQELPAKGSEEEKNELNNLLKSILSGEDANSRDKMRAFVEQSVRTNPEAEAALEAYMGEYYPDFVNGDMPDWKDYSKRGISNQMRW